MSDPRWEEYCREFMKGCSNGGERAISGVLTRPQDCPECIDAFVKAIARLRDENKEGEVMSDISTELEALRKEFKYAEEKWKALEEFNSINDYAAYVTTYLGTAVQVKNQDDPGAQYAAFIKAANLAMTAAHRIRTGTMCKRVYDADRGLLPDVIDHNKGRTFTDGASE